jgi:SAM-dependent methyltransferase
LPNYAALHAPHAVLLRAALLSASPPGARVALELGCGQGDKRHWLAACAAPGALVLGLDHDRTALRAAPPGAWLAADAHALPLRPACADLIWCVAALGLFANPPRALAEARRALRPGGTLVVAVATERWVRPRHWPVGAGTALASPPAPADDLGADLSATLAAAGLRAGQLWAYLLDPPGLAPLAALLPLAELPGGAPLAVGEPEPLPVLLVATARA